jgi:hypothetical protein
MFTYIINGGRNLGTNLAVTADKQAAFAWIYFVASEGVNLEFLHPENEWSVGYFQADVNNVPSEGRNQIESIRQLLVHKPWSSRGAAKHPSPQNPQDEVSRAKKTKGVHSAF